LVSALAARFQWDEGYLIARADYEDRMKRLVALGHISEKEESDLEEFVFGMSCSAADAVAEAWYDAATRSLLPEAAFEPSSDPAEETEGRGGDS
jgi:hypothetical protein